MSTIKENYVSIAKKSNNLPETQRKCLHCTGSSISIKSFNICPSGQNNRFFNSSFNRDDISQKEWEMTNKKWQSQEYSSWEKIFFGRGSLSTFLFFTPSLPLPLSFSLSLSFSLPFTDSWIFIKFPQRTRKKLWQSNISSIYSFIATSIKNH